MLQTQQSPNRKQEFTRNKIMTPILTATLNSPSRPRTGDRLSINNKQIQNGYKVYQAIGHKKAVI